MAAINAKPDAERSEEERTILAADREVQAEYADQVRPGIYPVARRIVDDDGDIRTGYRIHYHSQTLLDEGEIEEAKQEPVPIQVEDGPAAIALRAAMQEVARLRDIADGKPINGENQNDIRIRDLMREAIRLQKIHEGIIIPNNAPANSPLRRQKAAAAEAVRRATLAIGPFADGQNDKRIRDGIREVRRLEGIHEGIVVPNNAAGNSPIRRQKKAAFDDIGYARLALGNLRQPSIQAWHDANTGLAVLRAAARAEREAAEAAARDGFPRNNANYNNWPDSKNYISIEFLFAHINDKLQAPVITVPCYRSGIAPGDIACKRHLTPYQLWKTVARGTPQNQRQLLEILQRLKVNSANLINIPIQAKINEQANVRIEQARRSVGDAKAHLEAVEARVRAQQAGEQCAERAGRGVLRRHNV